MSGCGCKGQCGCGSPAAPGHLGAIAVAYRPNLASDYNAVRARTWARLRRSQSPSKFRARQVGRLGYLGATSQIDILAPKLIGTAATVATSTLIGTAAGTAGAAAFGAAAGSVVPVVGTVVGAVVGILSSKLFGHANYAQVANDVAASLQYAQAYPQYAGTYAGRAFGIADLTQVWDGLMASCFFPQNPCSYGWASAPSCNVSACIAGKRDANGNCPGCGGHGDWMRDILTGTGAKALRTLIKQANNNGAYDPRVVYNSYVLPSWNGPKECSSCIDWFAPNSVKNPSLYQQLVIDTIDAIEAQANPQLPVFYGQVPQVTNTTTATSVGTAAPATVQSAPPVTPSGAVTPQVSNAPATVPAGWMQVTGANYNGYPVYTPSTSPGAWYAFWNGSALLSLPSGWKPSAVSATPTQVSPTPGQLAVPGQLTPAILQAAGYIARGSDPTTGNTLWQLPNSSQVSVLVQGALVPYTPSTQATTVPIQSPNQSASAQYVAPVTQPTAAQTSTTLVASIPSGYAVVAYDSNGNPVYQTSGNPNLYSWTGSTMTPFVGQIAQGNTTNQQLQQYMQALMDQGYSQQQAINSALSSMAQQGAPLTPAVVAQTQAAAPAPSLFSGNNLLLIGGVALALILFKG